jgi:hypothetical protein
MKTTQLENKLSELFKAADYSGDFDNRSFDVKALNKAIAAGLKIQIIKKGFIRETSAGFKWNVRLSVGEKGMVYRFKYTLTPYDILNSLAKAIKEDKFDLKSGTKFKLAEPCSKCHGHGIIPYYAYYCNGICFDCLGLGYKGEYTTVQI